MSKRKFKKEYKKMHKRLIRLAKQFKYWDYDFTLKILQQCLSMVRLAWENPQIALVEDINDPMNEYKESIEGLRNIEIYYEKYKKAYSECDYIKANYYWKEFWKTICEVLPYLWD